MACLMDAGVAASIGAGAHGPGHDAHSAGHHERHEDASPSDGSRETGFAPCPLAAACGGALVASPEPDEPRRRASPERVAPARPSAELRSVTIAPEPPPPRTV